MTETTDVVIPTLRALNRIPGVWAMRVHSGSARNGRQQLAPTGTPDLFAVVRGTPVFLECKIAKTSPSAEQLEQMRRIKLAGGTVHVVRSVAEAIAVVKEVIGGS